MKLKDYINFYVNDEGHWYVSKIIQYNEDSVNKLAKGLHLISDLLSKNPNKKTVSKFVNFKPAEQPSLFKFKTKQIPIDNVSKLFISIQILASDLIDSSHLSATNPKKFKIFLQIKKHFFVVRNSLLHRHVKRPCFVINFFSPSAESLPWRSQRFVFLVGENTNKG